MATAVLEFTAPGSRPIDLCAPENYGCPDADDGLHDWGGVSRDWAPNANPFYCTECGMSDPSCERDSG